MSIDFREVLKELETREARLVRELDDIKAAKPAIERMARATPVSLRPSTFAVSYAGLGTKDAILALLAGQKEPMAVGDIARALLGGGIVTKAADFPAVVKSTLASLKTDGKVERKEEGWVLLPTALSELDSSASPLPSLQ